MPAETVTHLVETYGYLAVFLFVMVESMGVPLPGESMLLAGAVYAGTTGRLEIVPVILAASGGAVLGDNVAYWIGREGGYRLVGRYGRYVRLDERRLKLGRYLFLRHGGKVVFFGRFVAVLRTFVAFLAGTNRMDWTRFLVANVAGGVLWASVFGLGGYFLGEEAHRLAGSVRIPIMALGAVVVLGSAIYLRRNERRLEDEAERSLACPLDERPVRAG